MRNWINLIESNLPAKLDSHRPAHMTVQGALKDNMSPYEAKAYLDSHPDGLLHHDMFENSAFIAVTINGNYVFFDDLKRPALQVWNWEEDLKELLHDENYDIMVGWWYEPAQEFVEQTNFEWDEWDAIRNEAMKAAPLPPKLDHE